MWDKLQIALGQRIKHLRKERGYSQAAFADFTGITQAYLSRIERGKANPPLEIIQKITVTLGITIPELFDFDDKEGPQLASKDKRKKLIDIIEELPLDVIEKLYNVCNIHFKRK